MHRIFKSTAPCFLFLLTFLFAACNQYQTATVLMPEAKLVCEEAISEDLSGVSDGDLAFLMDKALEDGDIDSCWQPLMKKGLDQSRNIPEKHLTEAVKRFNTRGQQNLFHKAVLTYLNKKADSGGYSAADRRLLESFSSMVIHRAKTSSDTTLSRTRQVCQRLDPELYTKIFE